MSLAEDLWAAQSGLCALCGEAMPRGRFETPHASVWKKLRPTIDHIRPRVKGGSDERANLQLAHASCNRVKGSSWNGGGA
jgi:5-methylcytosine-specific restriction endonuclease McrA